MRNLMEFDEMREEQNKLTAITSKLSELQTEKRTLEERVMKIRQHTVRDEARQMIDGTPYDAGTDLYDRIEGLERDIQVHNEAAAQQRQNVSRVKSFCSKKICDELQSEYSAVIRKFRDAAQLMLQAIELNRRFIGELHNNEIEIDYIVPVVLPLKKEALEHFIESVQERCKR